MAKVTVPIIKLDYPSEYAFTNDVYDIFESEGAWNPVEDFTFTGRVSLTKDRGSEDEDAEVEKKRARIREKLRQVFQDEAEYTRLIELLDANDWDLSFFVDCY